MFDVRYNVKPFLLGVLLMTVLTAGALSGTADDVPLLERPDLVVRAVAASPSEPSEGEAVSFFASVHNRGLAPAGNFSVLFEVDGRAHADVFVGTLPAGATRNITSPEWAAVAGNHAVRAVADPAEHVEESEEDNNDAKVLVAVRGRDPPPQLPDLVVSHLTMEPADRSGDVLHSVASITNVGDAPAAGFVVRFTLDGSQDLGARRLDGLRPGATIQVRSDGWNATDGRHVVQATADARQEVAESDEDNNGAWFSFEIGPARPLSDLGIASVGLAPQAAVVSDSISFLAQVVNKGEAAAGGFRVQFFVDAQSVGYSTVEGLDAGDSTDVLSPPWNKTRGDHVVTALADATRVVAESNEDNNKARSSFTVSAEPAPAPDLAVGGVQILPDPPREDDLLRIRASVTNLGGTRAGPFVVRFVLDGSVPLGERSVKSLEPTGGGEGRAQLESDPWRASSGNHSIQIEVDAEGQVEESNEANNAFKARFWVEDVAPAPPPRVTLYEGTLELGALGQAARADAFALDRAYGDLELVVACPGAVASVSLASLAPPGGSSQQVASCGISPVVRAFTETMLAGAYLAEISGAGAGRVHAVVTGIPL